jgi:membrane protein
VQKASKLTDQAKLRLERARADHPAIDIVVRTFRRFSDDDGGFYAAALTYYAFFSIFPLIVLAASLLGWVTFLSPALQDRLLTEGVSAVPLLSDLLTQQNLEQLQKSSGRLALVGLVLTLYAGSGGIVALQHALNRIHRSDAEPGFVPKRLRSLRWLGAVAAAGLVTVGLGGLASASGAIFGDSPVFAFLVASVVRVLGAGLNVVAFAAAFMMLPARRQGLRDVLPGAVAAGIAFEVLKAVGSWYLASGASSREATFGTFAAAAGLLVASYLLAQLTLLAVELNAVLAERKRTRQSSVDAQEERSSG